MLLLPHLQKHSSRSTPVLLMPGTATLGQAVCSFLLPVSVLCPSRPSKSTGQEQMLEGRTHPLHPTPAATAVPSWPRPRSCSYPVPAVGCRLLSWVEDSSSCMQVPPSSTCPLLNYILSPTVSPAGQEQAPERGTYTPPLLSTASHTVISTAGAGWDQPWSLGQLGTVEAAEGESVCTTSPPKSGDGTELNKYA